MSLTVNPYYAGKNGSARKFIEKMESSGVADRIRQESGNEKYDYFIPMDSPETIFLIDSWKDQQSLDVHRASPMMKELAGLRKKYDLHIRVKYYTSNENGMSSTDQKFIRK